MVFDKFIKKSVMNFLNFWQIVLTKIAKFHYTFWGETEKMKFSGETFFKWKLVDFQLKALRWKLVDLYEV